MRYLDGAVDGLGEPERGEEAHRARHEEDGQREHSHVPEVQQVSHPTLRRDKECDLDVRGRK